ncbi:MAG: hypothetical protein FJX99_02840 [Bacteroidetes bacterium]|nr:hypothetical protein [Bacteroidota bacterium]
MRLILVVFLVSHHIGFSQKYLFNGKTDSVFYQNTTNSFFVKQGVPMSMDGSLLISKTADPKTFAVKVAQAQTQESTIYILLYLENPETSEQEKVVIDKFLIHIKNDYPGDSLCLVGLNEKNNPKEIELNICGPLERGLILLEYDILFENQAYSVKSGTLTDEIRKKLASLPTGKEVIISALCRDLLNNTISIKQKLFK